MPLHIQEGSQARAGTGHDRDDSPRMIDRPMLIDGLNHDLAGEYQAIVMYTHYSAKLTGPYRRELRALFQLEIPDELGHANFSQRKLPILGANPRPSRAVPAADEPREMLENALRGEAGNS